MGKSFVVGSGKKHSLGLNTEDAVIPVPKRVKRHRFKPFKDQLKEVRAYPRELDACRGSGFAMHGQR